MATIDELHAALVKADAAGDKAGAKILADHIRALSAAPVAAAAPDAPAAPAPPQGILADAWDGAKNLGLGLVKGVSAPIDGAAGLVTNGLSTAAHAVAPGSSVDKYMQGERDRVAAINSDRENKYQAMTPGSISAGVGNVIGNILVPLPGASVVRGGTLIAKSANALKTGAVIGAAQPVYGDQSNYWHDKAAQVGIGAATGAALSGLGTAAGSAYNSVRPLVSPSSAVGNQIFSQLNALSEKGGIAEVDPSVNALMGSRNPGDVLARLKAHPQYVPGSLPTTAQVAGVPELVMAEKTLKNNPAYRGPFEDRAIANNQARMAALRNVAGTPEALQAAQEARRAATAPLYDAALQQTHPIDEGLQAILDRPSAQAAIARGQKLAAEQNEVALPLAGRAAQPERQQASALLDANGKPFTTTIPATPEVPATIDGKTLQYLKMGVQDLQTEGKRQGIGAHEANALASTESHLHDWITRTSPEYANADAQYAATSIPVNTMEAGQQLHNALTEGQALNAAGDAAPALARFRTQYAAALKNSPYGIDPSAKAALDGVQNDLQRETISNSIRSAGSDTIFNAQAPNWLAGKLFGNNLDGKSPFAMGLGGLIAGHGTLGMAAAGGIMGAQKIGQFVGNRVNGQFQKAMLHPDYFAQLLQDAIDRNAGGAAGVNYLSPVGARAATMGASNALTSSP